MKRAVSHFAAGSLACAVFLDSLAAQVVWDGGAGRGNWGDVLNWDTNTVPLAGDSVTFDGSIQPTVDFQANRTVNELTFAAGATAFTLNNFTLIPTAVINNSGLTQTINSDITLNNNRTFTANDGELLYGGTIALSYSTTNRTLTLTGVGNHTSTASLPTERPARAV